MEAHEPEVYPCRRRRPANTADEALIFTEF